MRTHFLPPTSLRVNRNTSEENNRAIIDNTLSGLKKYQGADRDSINARIDELDREWDTERVLEANATALILAGLVLGVTVSQWWLVLSGLVALFFFQHALQGWCPPLPLIRKLGIRTMAEINTEKMLLKVMRGDFKGRENDPEELMRVSARRNK